MFGEKWFSIIITQYKKSGECISIDFMIHAMILLYTHLSFTVLLWMMQSHIMYNFSMSHSVSKEQIKKLFKFNGRGCGFY